MHEEANEEDYAFIETEKWEKFDRNDLKNSRTI